MRSLLLLPFALLATPAFAADDDDMDMGGGGMSFSFGRDDQGDLSKKATLEEVLPAKGDIALSFDAAPMLTYVGSVIAGSADGGGLNAYVSGYDQMIVGKYFLSPNMAARARLGLKFNSTSETSYYDSPLDQADPDVDPADWEELSDTTTSNEVKVLVGGGVEMRRGYRRLQGVIGGEALVGLATASSATAYGYDYDQDAADLGVIGDGSERPLSESSGLGVVLGARGFAGVEYFVLPKISLGMEYGYGLSFGMEGRGSATVEKWDGENEEAYNEVGSGSSSGRTIRADVDNGIDQTYSGGTGSVTVNFHF